MTNKIDALYKTNIKRLALLTLPLKLRRPLVGALIYSGVAPLAKLLNELRKYRSEMSYRLRHNGQVCKLRGVLNDEFDPEARRIRVEDSDSAGGAEASKAWIREEGRWVMVPRRGNGKAQLHREGFTGTGGYDFWVTVPIELRDPETETRMRSLVNMYKLASKRYAINYE